jgi:hypothetical protein
MRSLVRLTAHVALSLHTRELKCRVVLSAAHGSWVSVFPPGLSGMPPDIMDTVFYGAVLSILLK